MGLRLDPDRADDASRMLDGSGIHLYLPPNVEPRHLEALCSDLFGAILAWAGGIAVGYAPLLQEGGGEEEAEAPPELRDTDFRGRRIAYVTALPEDPAAHAPVLESARRTASSLVAPHNGEPAIAYLPPGVDLWAWLKGRVRAERRPAFSDLLGRAEALGLPKETHNPGSEAAGVEAAGVEGADGSQASEADAPAGEGTPPASELGAGPAHITRTPEERAKVRSRRQGRQAYRRPIPPQERFTKRERVAAAFVAVVVAVALWRLLLFVGGLAGDTLPEFLAAYPLPIAIVVGMLAGLYVWLAHAAKRERETRLLGGQAKT